MVFATLFIACADNNVCVAPEYTQPIQDTTAVQDTTFEPVYDTTVTQPIQDTTDTTVYDTTYTQPIQDTTDTNSYEILIGDVCTDMNFQSTGTLTSDSDVNAFLGTWLDKCIILAGKAPSSYIPVKYKLDKIVTILMDNLSFDSNLVNSLLTQLSNSVYIVYIYNTNSGLNFLYIGSL